MERPQQQAAQRDESIVKMLEPGDRLRTLYIVATCILAATVPLILFTGLWIWNELADSQRETEQQMVVRALQLSNEVDSKLEEQYSILQGIASLPSLDDANMQTFQRDSVRMKGAMPQWRVLSLYDAIDGRLVTNTLGQKDIASTPGMVAIVKRVAETEKPSVCSCYITEPVDDPKNGIHIFVPVFRNDAVRYILSVTIQFDIFQNMVTSAAVPNFLVGIIDDQNRIMARSLGIDKYLGQSASEDIQQGIKGHEVDIFVGKVLEGQVNFNAFSRSQLTHWVTVVGASQGEMDELSTRSIWTLGISGVLSISLAAILAIVLIYNMMLRRIASERIAASQAVGALQTQLLSTTQEALEDQSKAASEREVLLRELYHRVKNNLQIIQSLLRLGARHLSPEQREPFETAVRRIGAMARVHTLLYNSPDLASIDLKDYLASIVTETSEGFGADALGIRTRLDALSMRVPLDAAIPIAFIAIELLTNAYKHAFPDGRSGTIDVIAKKEGENGILIITDDGIGVPEAKGGRKPLGLNLVSKLVEQIGGTLEVPKPGESTYRITFPLTEKTALPDEAD